MITDALWGIKPVMINAALVSAQQRKRLFWVGKRVGDHYYQVEITQPEDRHIYLKDIIESGVVDRDKSLCIDASYYKGGNLRQYLEKCRRQQVFDTPDRVGDIGSDAQAQRVFSLNGKSATLSANGGGQGAKTGLYACAIRGRSEEGCWVQQLEIGSTDKSNALTSVRKDSLLADDFIIRKLSPIECERLQGLEDNYTEGISNTQRYKCLGNAFNVDVIAHILSSIFRKEV